MRIPHRISEIAYPILLDPIFEDGQGWYLGWNPQTLAQWTWEEASGAGYQGKKTCFLSTSCWGPGLYTRSAGNNQYYYPGSWGQYAYYPPNVTSYVREAGFWPINGTVNNCPGNQPHGYVGMWNDYVGYGPGGGSLGVYQPVSVATAGYNTGAVGTNGTRRVVVGIRNTGSGISLACGHEFFVGQTTLWLDDPEKPTISSVSGTPGSQWVTDTTPVNITVKANDPGLGVRFITISPEGTAIIQDQVGCSGVKTSPCPMERVRQFNLNGLFFDQGEKQATIIAEDPVGNSYHVSSPYNFTTRVDRTPPEVALNGQLAEETGEKVTFGEGENPQANGDDELSLPVYNLEIKAKDGNKVSAAQKRSGVKDIKVFLDGTPKEVPWQPLSSCPETSCERTVNYSLRLDGLSAGPHTLEVVAVDFVGKELKREIEFEYIPATGMKDEYVMQYFPLPDGQGNEAEEEHPSRPELAVNVMNGNLVYREKDVDVPGYAADLEVERFYNSQLPNSENTEWGDGWTLAQTPELTFGGIGCECSELYSPPGGEGPEGNEGGPVPTAAGLVEGSGAMEDGIQFPTEVGKSSFDPELQATVTMEAGGYKLADESGETDTAIVFNASGRTDELRTGSYAKIDYSYAAGKLDEIAIKDPGSVGDLSPAEEEALEYVPPAPSYQSSFGASGTGDGQLKAPADVAVAANGNIWVVDKTNNRIQQFTSAGAYVSKFGTAGSGNGQFNRPTSIAIDPSGNLWVADATNNRIQKFNEKGEFLKAVGSYGTGNGQFAAPEGIATDAKGNVYVADTMNKRIQKLNSAGEFLAKFGSSGSGDGQFGEANSIDIGPGGKVWVVDWVLNCVTQFNEAGAFVQKFGSYGTGNGQLNHPDAIEVDSRGNVWVGDQSNNRVQQFNQAGKYLAKFGTAGSGSGQFSFTYPMGIAVDNKGGLWVTDVSNNRIQKWSVPNYRPSWSSAFGTLGTGDGQLKAPGDVAIDDQGYLWVVDRANNRIQKFDQTGKYVSKFGATGSANGQFNRPTSIAIDGSNNLWVADSNNNRIQKFNENGEFLKAIGSSGTGNAQFLWPEGIATDLKGNIYVADTYNARIQVFNEAGEFLSKFGSAGSGPGQFSQASAIDVGPHGKIWVADWGANRIEQFNEKGEFSQQFGSAGTGDGQFGHPSAIEADNKGNVWVGDLTNGRVELFNEAGEYVTQFGVKGSGEGQFSLNSPMGIAAGSSGALWVTDVSNNRIQKWQVPSIDPPKVPEENDPSVDVGLSSGFVSSVEGDEAGVNTYAHSGELLTANKGPDGETKYEYDTAGRLKKVTLPNGTYGLITYNATYGRVESVTVAPGGTNATTTYFTYTDSPSRRTEVTPPNAATITYDIGEHGDVFKWSNSLKAPEFHDLAGLLYAERETATSIPSGDKGLIVEGYSADGISTIEIIANGHTLVHEKTCQQDFEKPGIECVTEITEWVTNTNEFPPGILTLEIVLTDRLGKSASKRFWVNIPVPPPPPAPGSPVAPTFGEIQNFRDEMGLDIVDPVANELERNDRIFDLINAWWDGDSVARATRDRWGVPLRTRDVEELEFRRGYVDQASTIIPQWAEAHAPSTYAGYYLDHREGGVIHIGFTQNQAATVEALKEGAGLSAPPARVTSFPTVPLHSYSALTSSQATIASHANSLPSFTRASVDLKANVLKVGTTSSVAQMTASLESLLGPGAPIAVFFDTEPPVGNRRTDRDRVFGRVRAGDRIYGVDHSCTANVGAWLDQVTAQGSRVFKHFLLTAGHCGEMNEEWTREAKNPNSGYYEYQTLGKVRRTGVNAKPLGVDAMAILLQGGADSLAP